MPGPVVISTLGAAFDHQHTLSAHCEECQHSALLDLQALAERLGRDFDYVDEGDWLQRQMFCTRCGGKQIKLIVGGPTYWSRSRSAG